MNLAEQLLQEKQMQYRGGLYWLTQVKLAYNSNRIEGSRLTEEQTRYMFETKTLLPVNDEATSIDDIIETQNHFELFNYMLDTIHPFQDGNGRVGRMIMFRECLANQIMPFIIEDAKKAFYYRGLAEYKREPGYLRDTCLDAQDHYAAYYDKLKIKEL